MNDLERESPHLKPFIIEDTSNHRTVRFDFDDDGTAMLTITSGDGVDEVHRTGIEITVDDDLARLFAHVKPMMDYLAVEEERETQRYEVQRNRPRRTRDQADS